MVCLDIYIRTTPINAPQKAKNKTEDFTHARSIQYLYFIPHLIFKSNHWWPHLLHQLLATHSHLSHKYYILQSTVYPRQHQYTWNILTQYEIKGNNPELHVAELSIKSQFNGISSTVVFLGKRISPRCNGIDDLISYQWSWSTLNCVIGDSQHGGYGGWNHTGKSREISPASLDDVIVSIVCYGIIESQGASIH